MKQGAATRLALLALLACPAALAQSSPDFGPNVLVFNPGMPAATIEATLTSISHEDQFSANRHAVLFKPGAYAIQAPVGYYEQIAGLGAKPGDVSINGFLTPDFGVPVYGTPSWPQANLTDTFWRSLENMTVNPVTNTLQNAPPSTLQWGVSQGAPLRRMQINGGLELVNSYCGEASGGFASDLVVTGTMSSCSQQQWFTRSSAIGSWSGGVWNMVFAGVTGAPTPSYPNPPETVVDAAPVSREKPFLYVDARGKYKVFSPDAVHNGKGTTWATGTEAGRSIPIERFFLAQPSDSAEKINLALALGRNLILTPGVYKLDRPIHVLYPGTVVLGLGYATLVPQTGQAALEVADVDGVQVAGLIVDAGPVHSTVLVKVGEGFFGWPLPAGGLFSHARNPSSLNDIDLRIGGASVGRATTALEVDSSDVILDDIWAWRADHGVAADGSDVGWTVNPADHGLVVNGNRVTALGLVAEHFEKSEVVWNGNGGETIFFQNELPYDVPSQAAWTYRTPTATYNGYPAYEVTSGVRTHQAYGLGMYSFFNQGLNIMEDNAMLVPTVPGVQIHNAGTVFLTGSGQISHVIDGVGAAANASFADQVSGVVTYP